MLTLVGWAVLGIIVLLTITRGARYALFGLVWYDHLRPNDIHEDGQGVGELLRWTGIKFSLAFTALVVGSLIVRARKYRITTDRFHWAVLVFFLAAVNSSLFAPCFGPAAGRIDDYFKALLQYYCIAAFIRDEKDMRQLFWAEATVMASVALYFCFHKFIEGGRLWEGATGDRNEMAMAMVMVMPVFVALGLTATSRGARLLAFGAMVPMALTVLFCGSRGGMLGLGAVMFYVLFRLHHKRWLVGVAVMVGLVGAANIPPEIVARFSSIGTASRTDASAIGRINAWSCARGILRARPLSGMGVGNFLVDFGVYADNPRDVHVAHSSFFQIMGDQGYPGLLTWLYLVFMSWAVITWLEMRVNRLERGRWTDMRYVFVALKAAWVGYALCGAFLSQDLNDQFIHVLAIVSRYTVFVGQREGVVRDSRRAAELAARKSLQEKRVRELAEQGIHLPQVA